MTIPNRAQRSAPRIATPLAPELNPAQVSPKALVRTARTTTQGIEARVIVTAAPSAKESAPVAPVPERPARIAKEISERSTAPSMVAQQAAFAASVLTQAAGPAGGPFATDTIPPNWMTLASHEPAPASSDLVRVHQVPLAEPIAPQLAILHAPDSAVAASFRVLRHRLSLPGGPKVTMVTSPRPGEGKTTCAVNLALALSEAGRARVLLLELNFRRPALARLLGFRPPVCFCEQVEFHRVQPMQPWIVVENVSPWLHTAAVSPDLHARPLLDGPAVGLCLEQLRGAGYDHIVIDSPAVLGSADVNLIEVSVDGIIVVLSARRSRARALRKAV